MDLELAGKNVFVAAASKGIGRAVAIAFAHEAANVHICGRDRDSLDEVLRSCQAAGASQASASRCDLGTAGGPKLFIDAGLEKLGGIDVLITNCGGPPAGRFDDVDEHIFQAGIDTTLRSVERLTRAALPHLRTSKGCMVHLSSLTVKQPELQLFLSNVLRLAVVGFSKSIADAEGIHGLRSNCVLTGRTDTQRLRELAKETGDDLDATYSRWAQEIPLRRIGQTDEIASAVLFLASPRASYISGSTLSVDGGLIRSPV